MRLGLIGTGKQGQRYLEQRNGGRYIVKQIAGHDSPAELDGLDGVVIATHPAGHTPWAMECIERGLPMLIEKPLALTWDECDRILNAARLRAPILMAHIDLWNTWLEMGSGSAVARIWYTDNKRDYSAWLDWAPHALAILARADPKASPAELARHVEVEQRGITLLQVRGDGWQYTRKPVDWPTPMLLMMHDFVHGIEHELWFEPDETRRIYRALFSEEHGQGK